MGMIMCLSHVRVLVRIKGNANKECTYLRNVLCQEMFMDFKQLCLG